MASAGIPALSDFPLQTGFIIKEFDVPLAKIASDGKVRWENWFGGIARPYDSSGLKVDNHWPAASFEEWAGIVALSIKK